MSSRRIAKVAEALREQVSTSILCELKDPRVKYVTVTRVEVSPDLRNAKIHVSVMGDEKTQRLTLRGPRIGSRVPAGQDRRARADAVHADPPFPPRSGSETKYRSVAVACESAPLRHSTRRDRSKSRHRSKRTLETEEEVSDSTLLEEGCKSEERPLFESARVP